MPPPKPKKILQLERKLQQEVSKQIPNNFIGQTSSATTFQNISARIQQQIAAKFGMNANFADIQVEPDYRDPAKIHVNVSVPILNVNNITFHDQDLIGYVRNDGRILSILCEREGNDTAGTLYYHYDTISACEQLIRLGNVDILKETPEQCETQTLVWDSADDPDVDFGSSVETFLSYGKNMYSRVFVRTHDHWLVWDKDKTSEKLIKLGTYLLLS